MHSDVLIGICKVLNTVKFILAKDLSLSKPKA